MVDLLALTSLPQEELVEVSSPWFRSSSLPFLRRSELVSLVDFLGFASDFPSGTSFAASGLCSSLARHSHVPANDFLRSHLPLFEARPFQTLMSDRFLLGGFWFCFPARGEGFFLFPLSYIG